jgi:hypothetical protein
MQREAALLNMRVLVNMIYALGIQRRSPPLDPVNNIALFEQKLRKVRTILAGHTGDKGNLWFDHFI